MELIILKNQLGFINQRYLVGKVIVVNELVDHACNRSKKECFIRKVDFERSMKSFKII